MSTKYARTPREFEAWRITKENLSTPCPPWVWDAVSGAQAWFDEAGQRFFAKDEAGRVSSGYLGDYLVRDTETAALFILNDSHFINNFVLVESSDV